MNQLSVTESVYTVSQLNREARALLEGNFPQIWVEGEISNFVCPNSGHWYFSLKDATAQIRCAMFKMANGRAGFIPKDGMHVMIRGRISLYEGRGDYQLIAEAIEDAGLGKLQKAFEELKKRLSEKGLFDAIHKKDFPAIPSCIGIITSPTGAAIRDILHVLKRRFAHVPIIIYPTQVQGDAAAPQIVNAIQLANQRNECSVLILARGGGSLEDLWPFNEEAVAHAIFASTIPIVTGVGHEIDFTIADLVADLRAPTPSAAAELVTPDIVELLGNVKYNANRLAHLVKQKLSLLLQTIQWSHKHLEQQHPKRRLRERQQELDLAEIKLGHLTNSLIQSYQHRLKALAGKLDALSPLATLKRGFSITRRDSHVLTNVDEVLEGEMLSVRLLNGELTCEVKEKSHLR